MSLRVLVVDDNKDMVASTMLLLKSHGHAVSPCFDGSHVYDLVRQQNPDVVIVDVGLPGKNGWDVAREIRARIPGKRPVLIGVSGEYIKGADRALAMLAGFDFYVLKGDDPRLLVRFVEQARTHLSWPAN